MINFLKSIFQTKQKSIIYPAGTWLELDIERFTFGYNLVDSFIKLKEDFPGGYSIQVVRVAVTEEGVLDCAPSWILDSYKIDGWYKKVEAEGKLKKLECLLTKQLEVERMAKEKRIGESRKAIQKALNGVKC